MNTQAREMIKGIFYENPYYSLTKCKIAGTKIEIGFKTNSRGYKLPSDEQEESLQELEDKLIEALDNIFNKIGVYVSSFYFFLDDNDKENIEINLSTRLVENHN